MATNSPLIAEEPALSQLKAQSEQAANSTAKLFRRAMLGLASLKLTVTLFAFSIFLVFAGTLAQVDLDIWDVVHQYFRTWIAYIDLQVFFPPAFFPPGPDGEVLKVNGGFYYPGGWMLGGLLSVNLLAAHLFRFKPQVRNPSRLMMGCGFLFLGLVTTMIVILSGSNNNGLQADDLLSYSLLWKLLLTSLAFLWLFVTSSILWINKENKRYSSWATISLTCCSIALGAFLAWLLVKGSEVQLGDSSMRILWQLIKATVTGVILLVGCVMVFYKRGGIVLIHFGVALLMFSELLVGLLAVEGQLQLAEGEAANYISDIRTVELAVINQSQLSEQPEDSSNGSKKTLAESVVVIPRSYLNAIEEHEQKNGISKMLSEWLHGKPSEIISHELLPFDVRVDAFYKNASLTSAKAVKKNLATTGVGLNMGAVPTKAGTGVDSSSKVDQSAAYITLLDKSDPQQQKSLGTWLVALGLKNQTVKIGDQDFQLALRFKRMYRPYTMKLVDVRNDKYVGSNTPRNYSSTVMLYDQRSEADQEQRKSREVDIWMNNPLRFSGETFYQSNYFQDERTGQEFTSLAVVTNFGWMIPYVACMLVAVGLLYHFTGIMLRFSKRVSATSPVTPAVTATDQPRATEPVIEAEFSEGLFKKLLPLMVVILFGCWFASKARPPRSQSGQPNVQKFAQLPIVFDARVKPFDSFARNNLLIISKRSDIALQNSGVNSSSAEELDTTETTSNKSASQRKSMSAAEWLMQVITHREQADKLRIFRIASQESRKALQLARRKGMRYAYSEFEEQLPAFEQKVNAARKIDSARLDTPQRKMIELYQLIQRYNMIRDAFTLPPETFASTTEQALYPFKIFRLSQFYTNAPLSIPQPDKVTKNRADKRNWESLSMAATKIWLQEKASDRKLETPTELANSFVKEMQQAGELNQFAERSFVQQVGQIMQSQNPGLSGEELETQALKKIEQMPPAMKAQFIKVELQEAEKRLTQNISQSIALIMGETALTDSVDPYAESFLKILSAYQASAKTGNLNNIEEYNQAVAHYSETLSAGTFSELNVNKVKFESLFNQIAPFYYSAFLYLFAFLIAMLSLIFWRIPLGRSAFWLIMFTFIIHTLALISRMYISGRPPVTNLYASAVFIGWGTVLAGIIIELIFRLGFGNVLAAITGAATLGIAHFLSGDGDTITVMQAVLDTQFWLATHVVCITLGYAATFVAGILGMMFILAGLFSRALNAETRRVLYSVTYGVLCFAIFFSFVGTVLGGLWADDSWGRFWGWDPKENGALIIVLWNALVLHARWGAMVKERGMAVLVVAGNIVTGWSWFGVNELGVGLHSYGFTEGVLLALGLFVISQLAIVGMGLMPKQFWRSYGISDITA